MSVGYRDGGPAVTAFRAGPSGEPGREEKRTITMVNTHRDRRVLPRWTKLDNSHDGSWRMLRGQLS